MNLDISKNKNLWNLSCMRCDLTTLNLKNGNSKLVKGLRAHSNPNLKCIQVDNPEEWKSYCTTCGFQFDKECNTPPTNDMAVYFPDDNFKAVLIANKEINTNGDKEIQLSEAIAFKGTIDAGSKYIKSASGIENFINVTGLVFYDNHLSRLDVSKNTALTDLRCQKNKLTNIDISKNVLLTKFYCEENQLSNLDISRNKLLSSFSCQDNKLTYLNVSNNTALTLIYCESNLLTNLDVSKNIALKTLHCYNNKLSNLNVSQNKLLEELRCLNNKLTTLDVSRNPVLTTLYCEGNQLQKLDLSKNIALKSVTVTDNPSLTCIQVNNVANANSNNNWKKDEKAHYNTTCP